MRKEKNNRGSAMIIIIVVIAFVSILIATLYTMVVLNVQMKSIDRKAKDNFYTAESVLEQINLGLQKDLSYAADSAYAEVMQTYSQITEDPADPSMASLKLEENKRQAFNKSVVEKMKSELQAGATTYKVSHLEGYLTAELQANTVLDVVGTENTLVTVGTNGLVLKGLKITYTDSEGYQSIIQTDIHITAPDMNFLQASDLPTLFQFCLVADRKLSGTANGDGVGRVNIAESVYAGEGLTLNSGNQWNIEGASKAIFGGVSGPRSSDYEGNVDLATSSTLEIATGTDLWSNEIELNGGTLRTAGRTYVNDDLVLNGTSSSVYLGGEYCGYGNGLSFKYDDGTFDGNDGPSSAILVNGINSTLDMTNLRRLLVSGNAQISTQSAVTDQQKQQVESLSNKRVATVGDRMTVGVLASGNYSFRPVSTDQNISSKYVSSTNDGLYIMNDSAGWWESFQVVNNSDNSVSLRDYRHWNKYVTVRGDGSLWAESNTIGYNEKFWLKYLPENGGQYALLANANNKYVTVGEYKRIRDNERERDAYVISASAEAVTGDSQLFVVASVDKLPTIAEPKAVFTYLDDNSAEVRIESSSWYENPGFVDASMVYSVEGGTQNTRVPLVAEEGHLVLVGTLTGLKEGATVNYNITYKNTNGDSKYYEVYHHENKAGDVNNLQEGLYRIQSKSTEGTLHYNDANVAVSAAATVDAGTLRSQYYSDEFDIKKNDGSYLLRSTGTLSDPVQNNTDKYRFLRRDNDQAVVKVNGLYKNDGTPDSDNYQIVFEHYDGPYYFIRSNNYYLYVGDNGDLQYTNNNTGQQKPNKDAKNFDAYLFDLRWMGYSRIDMQGAFANEVNSGQTGPSYNMVYSDEAKAKASLSIPTGANYTLNGNPVLNYTINKNGANLQADMTVQNGVATVVIDGLNWGDEVSYTINYRCSDNNTRNTPRTVYKHVRSSFSTTIQDNNNTVNLGESVEVKSNQIAYLVPPECIGVYNGEALIGQNPMSAQQYLNLMDYADNKEKYPDFKIVDFDKKISGLGNRTLRDYHQNPTPADPGYQIVFVQSGGETMAYFYVKFTPENTSKYFQDYYSGHQDTMESYMNRYVNTLRTGNQFNRLILAGNMVQSSNQNANKIDIKSYGYSGSPDEELTYQKQYRALGSMLTLNYDSLRGAQLEASAVTNYVDPYAFSGMTASTKTGSRYKTTYGGKDIYALITDNLNATDPDKTFIYDNTGDQVGVCLILASGDVRVAADFSGTIVAGGNIVVDNGVKVTGNREYLRRVLQIEVDPTSHETVLTHFFQGMDDYSAQDSTRVSSETGFVNYAQYIEYENWSKQ